MGLDWNRFWVAEADGDIIGCCQVKFHRDGSNELASLVVHPGWRGKGVARALIEHFQQSHQDKLYLTCRADLGDFYRKFGFTEAVLDEMPKYFRRVFYFINSGKLIGREELRILVMESPTP